MKSKNDEYIDTLDLETGLPTKVLRREFELARKLFQNGKPIQGKIIIYGTPCDMKGGKNFKEMWDEKK